MKSISITCVSVVWISNLFIAKNVKKEKQSNDEQQSSVYKYHDCSIGIFGTSGLFAGKTGGHARSTGGYDTPCSCGHTATGSCGYATPGSGSSEWRKALSFEAATYTNDELGFTLKYPSKWTGKDIYQNFIVMKVASDQAGADTCGIIVIPEAADFASSRKG